MSVPAVPAVPTRPTVRPSGSRGTPRAALESAAETGGLPTDELLDRLLPLLRTVSAAHDDGLVADLDGLAALMVDDRGDWALASPPSRPRTNPAEIARVQSAQGNAVEVVSRGTLTVELGAGQHTFDDTTIIRPATDTPATPVITHPGHLAGYRTWESAVGQHDALADIFVLGELLGSLACGLNLFDPDDHERFVAARGDLFTLAPDLHPVVARAVREMTEPDRHRRAQDLRSLVRLLETYRDQPEDFDLGHLDGSASGLTAREQILGRLRDRLFDATRRNRLLHFKPTQQTVDLTVASVPQLLDHTRIRAESLLTWQPATAAALADGRHVKLGSYLRFEENPFLAAALDHIISQAKRDRAEYGFAQLRLVVSFLRWHDLRGVADEVVDSPLLLLPVALSKKKGVRDTYTLSADVPEAEVNPTLRQRLEELYDLHLPERVPLTWTAVAQFHADLAARVQASEPGVSVRTVEQPRIDLIQREARLHAALYARRRAASSARARRVAPVEHSYRAGDYRPLGLQLFLANVRPTALPQRLTAGGLPEPRTPSAVAARSAVAIPAPSAIATRATYTLRGSAVRGNPFEWEIDLCRLTLGNFNYRRMSLVQDYNRLLAATPAPSAFDDAFANAATPKAPPTKAPPTADQYLVVDSDSTQLQAIARARTGASFVIQGPPGTGKSQTITNLIADYVARGQRVLFVCEKRAAIDVVFHRLRSSGLDDLCCLIHDSQADKRAFVADLRATYERHVADDVADDGAVERRRASLVADVEAQLSVLRRLTDTLRGQVPSGSSVSSTGVSTTSSTGDTELPTAVALLEALITLRPTLRHDAARELTDVQRELLPALGPWTRAAPSVRRVQRTLADLGEDPLPSAHPVCLLAPGALFQDHPVRVVSELVAVAQRQRRELSAQLRHAELPAELSGDLAALLSLAAVVRAALGPLRDASSLRLLASSSPDGRQADQLVAEHRRSVQVAAAAALAAAGWQDPPVLALAAAAATAARRHEGTPLGFLHSSWRVARRIVREGFHGDGTAAEALERLVAAQRAAAAVAALDEQARGAYGIGDVALLGGYLERGRTLRGSPMASVSRAMARPSEAGLDELVRALQEVLPELEALAGTLEALLGAGSAPRCSLDAAGELLDRLHAELDLLPTLLDPLRALAESDPVARGAVVHLPLTADELELATGSAAIVDLFATDRALARLDGPALRRRIDVVAGGGRDLLETNAGVIQSRARRRLLDHLRTSGLPAAQLDAGGKAFKKAYAAGRRELEHEFGKVMRYKSIRELAGGAARDVVADLKPVWLMSPLSVSDTLPLEPDLFDVVIFDEASQVPVEEAAPALHRARQVIVVGDQMQLPPTSFFASAPTDDDDLRFAGDDDEQLALSLHGTSFLNQSACTLPSVLLAWHYRSRSEQLIGFSNAAFYGGQLRTVPDRAVHTGELPAIMVSGREAAAFGVGEVLRRPISYHRVLRGVYAERRNLAEAEYIAALVRELLAEQTGRSIGIVAFSEAQQGAIEAALTRLAGEDAVFAAQLEDERDREVEDQFVGLFVKNLENVQGDERDIVILSICYAPDPRGRMRMNFGPINAADGEKRLNVIFSRAKFHLVVVASIDHTAITNDWNDGANAFKGFLQYAAACSTGQLALSAAVLRAYLPRDQPRALEPPVGGLVGQLAAALRGRGYLVEVELGASQLRCDLAVRRPGDETHRLAVLIDHRPGDTVDDHERYIDRPRAFTSRGWPTAHVLAMDWLQDPAAVVARLIAELQGPADVAEGGAPGAAAADDPAGDPAAEGPGFVPAEPVGMPESASRSEVRRFEYVSGSSARFWHVWTEDSELHVRFGRIGSNGRPHLTELDTPAAATARMERLIREKLRGGYVEQRPSS